MQPIGPRFEPTFNGKPGPPEMPARAMQETDYVPFIMLGIFYIFGFLMACSGLATCDTWWIPPRVRGDACLAPLFFILPAFFWPLVFVMLPLTFVYLFLGGVVHVVWNLVGPATTCCGIPLPRRWLRTVDPVGAAGSSEPPDLEMGPVVASAEDEGEGEPSGGKDDSDPAGLRSAGSSESERPPPYTSLPRDGDENDSRETDGLLAKTTDQEIDTVGK